MITWIDLETTGLDTRNDRILEIAVILTDDKLNELATYECVFGSDARFDLLHPTVQKMHTDSGLWNEVQDSPNDPRFTDEGLAYWLDRNGARGSVLAGSTVSFDREFLRTYMPRVQEMLHYRNLDVTSVSELVKRFWPDLYEGRPRVDAVAHRAMADIRLSLQVARYYANVLGGL